MKVLVDGYAWLPKEDLTSSQILKLKDALTILPAKLSEQAEDPAPIFLYKEESDRIGIPRTYFTERQREHHEVEFDLCDGDKSTWPGSLRFKGSLRPEQERGVEEVVTQFRRGMLGGIVQAKPGFGKTVLSLALIAKLNTPALVVVHKEFLRDQWVERIEEFLPGAQVGLAQGPTCDYTGKHIVVGMVHSLAKEGRYLPSFYRWPGFVITDECFPGETEIATPHGNRRISDVREGDQVLSVAGVDRVVRKMSRLIPLSNLRLVKFESGEVITTADHPFLTTRGWVNAKDLQGEEVLTWAGCIDTMSSHGQTVNTPNLPDLQDSEFRSEREEILLQSVYGSLQEEKGAPSVMRVVWNREGTEEEKPVLFALLSSELVEEGTKFSGEAKRSIRKGSHMASGESSDIQGGLGTHAGTKSYEKLRGSKSGFQSFEGQTFSLQKGREWHRVNQAAGAFTGEVGRRVGDGVRGSTRRMATPANTQFAYTLQNRHSPPFKATGDRSGWGFSQHFKSEEQRSEKREVPATIGVDNVKVPQQDDLRRLGFSYRLHKEEIEVFNISVERHPSYVLANSKAVVHNCHRVGAATWSPVPAMFAARYRLGVSATPRRKDRAENVFFYHIGRILFSSEEQRMTPKVRRVWSNFRFVKSNNFNPNNISRAILINILVKSKARNRLITSQLALAVKAGRKVLVLSERLEHLALLERMLKEEMKEAPPSTGYYVGGMSKDERKEAETKQVIFATSQYAREGMDIPPLDTLCLTTPQSDVEQAVGRILRPYEGKKDPIVVDFRDDKVAKFRRNGESRDRYYRSIGVKT